MKTGKTAPLHGGLQKEYKFDWKKISMRLVAATVFLLLVALFFALWLQESHSAQKVGKVEEPAFLLYGAEVADWGQEKVVLIYPSLNEGKIWVECSQKPDRKFVILSGRSVPGMQEGLAQKIERRLSECGVWPTYANADEAVSMQDATVISALGALPAELYEAMNQTAQKNQRLISLVALEGKKIDRYGNIEAAEGEGAFEVVKLEAGKEEFALQALVGKALLAGKAVEFDGAVAIVPVESTPVYCSVVYWEEGGKCRLVRTGRIDGPKGRLIGPRQLLVGQAAQFEVSIEEERRLRLEAAVFSARKKVSKVEVGKSEAGKWIGLFSANISVPGHTIVKIEDQFGNLKAAAYLEAIGLEAKPKGAQANRHEFELRFGKKPVDGPVLVWMDSGQKKQIYASEGKLVVFASPTKPTKTINFEYKGSVASLDYPIEPHGLFDAYIRYGLPAAAFLVAAYLLMRANKKIKYRIVFPEPDCVNPALLAVKWKDIAEAYSKADKKNGGHRLPVYLEELAAEMPVEADLHSLSEVLEKLAKEGKICQDGQAYIPRRLLGKMTIRQAHALRVLHDAMLEVGLPFDKKANKAGGFKIRLFEGKRKILEKIKEKQAILFESSKQKEEFEEELNQNTAEDIKIKLAAENGKLIFLVPDKEKIKDVIG
ncbi:MAG: hypothetical protein N3G80_02670 [Candidatus Micrarchaeota archaeon]|nr:hypothetical protein [Candidatus Micrarchaeota archaeon]